ncbi:MAG: UPF0261 family protein [Planctomycetes bacterium]|nr:UPF0261 family protein [Planctomycetota bacterium]
MVVLLFATLDTKGVEAAFVRDRLRELGVETRLVDCGTLQPPAVAPDVSREAVLAAAGTTLEAVRSKDDRAHAVQAAARGARALALDLHARGELGGVLGLGGSAGTTIGTEAMRALPIGVPKLMVSTLASGNVRSYIGDKDIVMLNSVVDVLGINRVSRRVLSQAAHAMAGMVRFARLATATHDKPIVAATMFGVTTPCVQRAKEVLEAAGCEVLVFHATGTGGQAMESLVRDGLVQGVLDLTTTELADELFGGVLSAGPERMSAAARAGVPTVASVGATDMVNFLALDTVPAPFRARKLHRHNDHVTLMRTTPEENHALGREIARKLVASRGPARLFFPLRGVSALDCAGKPFDDPAARAALLAGLHSSSPAISITELDLHINDAPFAERCARELLALMGLASTTD